jgi:pimeloyl-ACP methyl ester carboxylesterase
MTEPLVLLPAMSCDARVFMAQLTALSADTAVTVAPVTQGERIEEIASDLLGQLPPKFALAGLGFGGMVALELMRRAPERITRIALMATSPLPESPQFAASREPRIVAARSGRLADCIRDEFPGTAFAPGPARPQVLAQVMAMGLSLGPDVYVRQSRALQRRKDQQATLHRIRQPVLILCGEHDSLNPVKRQKVMAELIPFSRLEVIAGAGHLPPLEQPEAVTQALRDWLKQPLVLR